MPPAARMPSAPSGGLGMPSLMWARPHAAKVRAIVPTMLRLVASSSWGARRSRKPRASRTSSTAYAMRPNVPANTAWTTWPKTPGTPHHSREATTMATAMKAKPRPSRRWSGSRSAALVPTRRTAPPARWETPIHVLRTARSGNGRPPRFALDVVPRAGGLRLAGRVERAAGRRDEAPPEPPWRGPRRRGSSACCWTDVSPWWHRTSMPRATHASHAQQGQSDRRGPRVTGSPAARRRSGHTRADLGTRSRGVTAGRITRSAQISHGEPVVPTGGHPSGPPPSSFAGHECQ